MNLAEVLLNADIKEVTKKNTVEFEVERLSKVFGTPFVLTLQEISPKRFSEIQNECIKMNNKGRVVGTDIYRTQCLLMADAIANQELREDALLKKFGCATPVDLYAKLFNAGEFAKITEAINKLCGMDNAEKEKQVEAVKN